MALSVKTTITRAELNEYLRSKGADVPRRFRVRNPTEPHAPLKVDVLCAEEDAARVRSWVRKIAERFGAEVTEE